MNRRPRMLAGIAIGCLALTLYFVVRAPAAAELAVITHTTLEEFNTGLLYHTGLTREEDGEVQLLVVGIAGEWISNTNATGLPARDRHTAVYHGGHIIVVGGKETDTLAKRDVYYTTVDPSDHDLADWKKTTALPASTYPNGLTWHASVVVHGRIYVLGGSDGTDEYATVSFAPIHADGNVGNWTTTTALPQALRLLQAAVINDRIYVVGGGQGIGGFSDQVYVATPNASTGQISGWTATTPFPYALRGHMVAVQDGRLYVMGGRDVTTFLPKVYYARPDPATGAIGAYTETIPMRNNLYGAVGMAYNGVLFTTGGVMNLGASPSDYVGANLIARDGGVGSWQDTSFIDPPRFFHAAVCSDDGWLYVIHGNDGPAPIASINRGATAGPGGNYAPEGIYTSRTIELPRGSQLKELRWNTTVEDPAITAIKVWYRARQVGSAEWPEWSGPYMSEPGTVTHTLELAGFARYFEYRADFETKDSSQTPVLNAVELVYLPPVYSLRLDKAAAPPSGSSVYPDDVVQYTVTYSNSAMGLTATHAVLLDMVPEHMAYVAGSIYGLGADDSLAPELTWALGDAAPGSQGEVGFQARVVEDYAQEVVLWNRALLMSTAGPVKYSNWVTHTAKLLVAELAVEKGATPPGGSAVAPGSRITYAISYGNPSIFDATGVVLTDTYDVRESYEVVSTAPQSSDASNCFWALGSVPAGEGGDVQVVVQLAEVLPNHWEVGNQVELIHEDTVHTVTDVVTHMVLYDGAALVDFRIDDVRWEPAAPAAGDEVTFYATVTNQGGGAAGQYFWVSLYIKPQPSVAPLGPYDHAGGYCQDVTCTALRPHFLAYVPGLAAGASVELAFRNLEWDPVFPESGSYDVYVQADVSFDGPDYATYWGRYPEDYEQNNVRHEVLVIPEGGPPRLYLPIVARGG